MSQINLRELILVVAGISFLSGFLMIYLKHTASYIKGTLQWAIGSFLIGAGLLGYGFYPFPNEYINLLATNLTAFIGQCFSLVAIWKFKGKKVDYYFIIGLPVMTFVVTTVFTLIIDHMGLRVAINSLLYACYAAYYYYEMLYPPDKSLKMIFSINAIAVLIYGLAMITRAIVSFQFTTIDLMAPSPESVILFSALSLSQMVLAFGFIIMVNIRLSQDLVRQIAMKDKFFSIIAHDLKNPMNNILGFSTLLNTELKNKDRKETEFIAQAINMSIIQINNLLENLLEWACSQTDKMSFKPEKINLRNFIADEARYYFSFAENKKLSIITICTKDIIVEADVNMLKAILRNLITNAVKYTNPGGTISIEARQLPGRAEVLVTDTGVGIPAQLSENLFTLGGIITTRGTQDEKGSGLGLVLCKEFVEKNGGTIRVNSESGKGTTFVFTLPLFRDIRE